MMASLKRILVVDDEPISLKVLSTHLNHAGFEIDQAKDGKEALEHLIGDPEGYSLVIADRIMPYMSGLELLHQMKAYPILNDIPFIMLTGLCEREDVIDAVQAGVFDYLIKPVEPALLMNLIYRALEYSDQIFEEPSLDIVEEEAEDILV